MLDHSPSGFSVRSFAELVDRTLLEWFFFTYILVILPISSLPQHPPAIRVHLTRNVGEKALSCNGFCQVITILLCGVTAGGSHIFVRSCMFLCVEVRQVHFEYVNDVNKRVEEELM